jgi:hypothetical protein
MEAPTFASGSREYPLKDKKEQKQKAEHLSLEKYKANIDNYFDEAEMDVHGFLAGQIPFTSENYADKRQEFINNEKQLIRELEYALIGFQCTDDYDRPDSKIFKGLTEQDYENLGSDAVHLLTGLYQDELKIHKDLLYKLENIHPGIISHDDTSALTAA